MSALGGTALGSAAGVIIGQLIAAGFTKVKESSDKLGNTIITGRSPSGDIIDVAIKNNAIISPQYDVVRVGTSDTKRNDNTPNYFLKNESSVIKRIFALSIIPDATMQSEGLIQINLNETKFFPITAPAQGFLTDTAVFTVPIPDTYGLKILPKKKLEVFIWNPSGNPVNATVAVFIGELP